MNNPPDWSTDPLSEKGKKVHFGGSKQNPEAKKKEEALAKQSADARSKEKEEKERQERRRLVSAKDLGSFKL